MILFSHQKEMADRVERWLAFNRVQHCTLNVITALVELGFIGEEAKKRLKIATPFPAQPTQEIKK